MSQFGGHMTDLEFGFKIALNQWALQLKAADDMVESYRQKWGSGFALGGGGGGGGMAVPSVGAGVAVNPPTTGGAQAALAAGVSGTARQVAAAAAAPSRVEAEAAAYARQSGPGYFTLRPGEASNLLGFKGGNASYAAAGNLSPGSGLGADTSPFARISGTPYASKYVDLAKVQAEGIARTEKYNQSLFAKQQAVADQLLYEAKNRAYAPGVSPGTNPLREALDSPFVRPTSPMEIMRDEINQHKASVFSRQQKIADKLLQDARERAADPIKATSILGPGASPMEEIAAFDNAAEAAKRKGSGLMGKMGLRNIIYGTVYGLVADVVAQGMGQYSQFNQATDLAGGNLAGQSRAHMAVVSRSLGAVPIIGGALSSLYGAMGADAVETRNVLSERQMGVQNLYAGLGFSYASARSQRGAYQTRAGSYAAIEAEYQQRKTARQAAYTQQSEEGLKQIREYTDIGERTWGDTAFDVSNYVAGVAGKLTGRSAQNQQDNEDNFRAALGYESRQSRRDRAVSENSRRFSTKQSTTLAAENAADQAQRAQAEREFTYDVRMTEAEGFRGTLSSRFTPGKAAGHYAERSLIALMDASGAPGTKLSAQDMRLFSAQGQGIVNTVEGQQYDILQTVLQGRAAQYNPYTTSPVAMTDRAKETPTQAYDALTNALVNLKNAILQFQNQGGP